MLVVEIDSDAHNYAIVEDEPYFLLRTSEERILVTRDKCPHRGGPLHLGLWNSQGPVLACPWHGTCFTEMALSRRAVPSVRCGTVVTSVFDAESDANVCLYNKLIRANER